MLYSSFSSQKPQNICVETAKDFVKKFPFAKIQTAQNSLISTSPGIFLVNDNSEFFNIESHFPLSNLQLATRPKKISVLFEAEDRYVSPSLFDKKFQNLPTWSFAWLECECEVKYTTDTKAIVEHLSRLYSHLELKDANLSDFDPRVKLLSKELIIINLIVKNYTTVVKMGNEKDCQYRDALLKLYKNGNEEQEEFYERLTSI